MTPLEQDTPKVIHQQSETDSSTGRTMLLEELTRFFRCKTYLGTFLICINFPVSSVYVWLALMDLLPPLPFALPIGWVLAWFVLSFTLGICIACEWENRCS